MKLYINLNTLLVFYFTAGIIISLEPFHFSMQSVHLVFSRVHHFLLGLSFLTLHFLHSHCCPNRKLHPQAQDVYNIPSLLFFKSRCNDLCTLLSGMP